MLSVRCCHLACAGRGVLQQITFHPAAPWVILATFLTFIIATYIPAQKGAKWVYMGGTRCKAKWRVVIVPEPVDMLRVDQQVGLSIH